MTYCRFRRTATAPEWSSTTTPAHAPPERKTPGHDLHYENVDKVYLSLQEKVPTGVPMSKQYSHRDEMRSYEDFNNVLLENDMADMAIPEMLDIEPHKLNSPSRLGKQKPMGLPWSRVNEKRFQSDEKVSEDTREYLMSSPFGKNVDGKGGVSMSLHISREDVAANAAVSSGNGSKMKKTFGIRELDDIAADGTVLDLDPQPINPTMRSKGGVARFSKEVSKELWRPDEAEDIDGDVLQLEPVKESITKPSRTGGSFSKSIGRLNNEFDELFYEDEEKLILSPRDKGRYGRDGKGTREWSKQDDTNNRHDMEQKRKQYSDDEKEELILEPRAFREKRLKYAGLKMSHDSGRPTKTVILSSDESEEELKLSPRDNLMQNKKDKNVIKWNVPKNRNRKLMQEEEEKKLMEDERVNKEEKGYSSSSDSSMNKYRTKVRDRSKENTKKSNAMTTSSRLSENPDATSAQNVSVLPDMISSLSLDPYDSSKKSLLVPQDVRSANSLPLHSDGDSSTNHVKGNATTKNVVNGSNSKNQLMRSTNVTYAVDSSNVHDIDASNIDDNLLKKGNKTVRFDVTTDVFNIAKPSSVKDSSKSLSTGRASSKSNSSTKSKTSSTKSANVNKTKERKKL